MADLVVVEVVLVDFDCMPGAVLALVWVEVDDLVVLAGLLIPAGLLVVVDLVVVVAAGVCDVLVVVIFDELLLMVVVGVVWAWADRPPATTSRARIWEKRFMSERRNRGVKALLYQAENVPKDRGILHNNLR